MLAFVIAIIPSVGVLFLFWLVVRAMIQADRREREARARFDAESTGDVQRVSERSPSDEADPRPNG